MAPSRPWLKENWFSLVQTLGIAAGILFTALTLRQDLHERRVSDYLALASQHRELWSQLQGNPRLSRLLAPDRNLVREPVTRDERLFLELTFTHFHTGWLLAREGSLTPMPVLATDAGAFFRLPAPRYVWESVREIHQPEFAAFIGAAIRSGSLADLKPRPGASPANR